MTANLSTNAKTSQLRQSAKAPATNRKRLRTDTPLAASVPEDDSGLDDAESRQPKKSKSKATGAERKSRRHIMAFSLLSLDTDTCLAAAIATKRKTAADIIAAAENAQLLKKVADLEGK